MRSHEGEDILQARQAAIQKIRLRFRPEFETELDGIRQDISGILNPQQAAKWQAWLDEKRRIWLPALPKAATQPS